jgi:enamine deaminase RidA (YjgF/YER057c/UK114 family)
MNYRVLEWKDLSVEALLGIFCRSGENISEYHAILRMTNATCDAGSQHERIEAAVGLLLECFPGTEVIWRRYFVDDIAGQHLLIPGEQDAAAVSVVQQPPLNSSKVVLWLYLIPKGFLSGRGQATVVAHSDYRHLFHMQLHVSSAGEAEQTELLFRQYAGLLSAERCTLADNCMRTWVFVRDIDTHYAGMAAARRVYFEREGLTKDTHFIASTGIEGRYKHPDVLVFMDAYAVEGLQRGQICYLRAPTHFNSTYEYGVTFERGTAIQYGDRRHVFISGTASINNRGEIVHLSDVMKQAGRMWENILTLLSEAGAGADDIACMIVYLRNVADCQAIDDWLKKTCPHVPKAVVWASVCRPGWLIEAECIAITAVGDERFAVF